MPTVAATSITPPDQHLVTALEAIEPLYEKLELQTETLVLAAALEAGWSPDEATKALAALRLQDALSTLDERARR
ncbi:hypothetical protein [Rhizobium sp. CCGE 510]|uniref:hypothetical protein n=1 Tax=Rhizobium sp. CCGE 510 TaxID=1132836 RepID=UPI00027B8367|nr:hypothetical protein [Rhizobium sp. CCGE 510]EJT06274.1 hypothetical protein RCCGE510_05357 [Rhizobium sp. CCGE 510]